MSLEKAITMLRGYEERVVLSPGQSAFLLRVATLAWNLFPDLEESASDCCIFPKGIELTNQYGVRAFYLKNNQAYVYQYQFGQDSTWWQEDGKNFDQFTDNEIVSVLKRKRFPYKQKRHTRV